MANKNPIAQMNWSMDIKCPKCKKNIDLADVDDDGVYSEPIFNNRWDDLIDEGVCCPNCDHEFLIGGVEY